MLRAATFSAILLAWISYCSAQSIYRVSIDTSQIRGTSGTLVFDITSNFPLTNRVDVINFSTDGSVDLPQTQGELVTGDLIQRLNPARITRIKANTFFTELALPFTAFGDSITFALNASETGPLAGRPPDEFSLFLLDQDGHALGTANRRSGQPNFSITITGARGGEIDTGTGRGSGVAEEKGGAGSGEGRGARQPEVPVAITPAWTPDDPASFESAQTYEGDLTEFCNRRCKGEQICTGGAFGIAQPDGGFYSFDDIGNLKAQVALVESGQNPLVEGQWGHAKVVGILKDSVITVREISLQ